MGKQRNITEYFLSLSIITFYKSSSSSDTILSDFQFHDFWTAGRKRQCTASLSQSFKLQISLTAVPAFNFLDVSSYIFSWSFFLFPAPLVSLIHTHSQSHALGFPFCWSASAISSLVFYLFTCLFIVQVRTHKYAHIIPYTEQSFSTFPHSLSLLMVPKPCQMKDALSGDNWTVQ